MSEFKEKLVAFSRLVFNPRSIVITLVVALFFFSISIVLKNITTLVAIAQRESFLVLSKFTLTIIAGFYVTVPLASYISLVIISLLTGVLISLISLRFSSLKSSKKSGLASGAAIAFGIIAPGCASCGVGIAAAFGLSAATISLLPLKGLELSLLAIIIIALSIWNISKPLLGFQSCPIPMRNERRIKKRGN